MSEFRSGNGAAWLDLLTTLAGRYRAVQTDDLADPARLRAWLHANGLEPTGAVTDDDLDLVRTTREALHRTTLAALDGRRPAAGDVRTLQAVLDHDAPLQARSTATGLAVSPPRTAREALARLVRDAVSTLAGDDLAHLHRCGDETCSSIYLDRTGRRRWCSDLSCGNRARVRAHRARTGSSSGKSRRP